MAPIDTRALPPEIIIRRKHIIYHGRSYRTEIIAWWLVLYKEVTPRICSTCRQTACIVATLRVVADTVVAVD